MKLYDKQWLWIFVAVSLVLFYFTREYLPELYAVAIALVSGFVALVGFIYVDDFVNGKINSYDEIKNRNQAYSQHQIALAIVYMGAYAITFIVYLISFRN
jgi:hypothetical protein